MMANQPAQTRLEDSIIPHHNREYLDTEFWEQRYAQYNENNDLSDSREWFGNYQTFAHVFRKLVNRNASILILGCGNSLLGEELYADGYHDIHNIDISPSVIQLMENHCDKCSKMKWSVMDCRQLRFANQSFDVVIEKATIEVFLVAEKSPWSISKSALQTLKMIGDEIGRVLKQSAGQFFSISFSAPHFRQPLYQRIFQGEDHSNTMVVANIHRLGEHFHYFLYHLVNDLSVQSMSLFTYEPPKQTKLHDHITNDDCNLFLYDISI